MKILTAFTVMICFLPTFLSAAESKRPNVLFIAVDDMRINLGCYGDKIAVTPNLDTLAARGILFNRAYCQFASCNASRASLLTGQRPDTISVYKLNTFYRSTAPEVITLPQHFKMNGYHTESIGKILHNYYVQLRDNELSWSTPARMDKLRHVSDYALEENLSAKGKQNRPAAECADVGDDAYYDGKITEDAVRTIKRLAAQDKPFFLAVGFMKPHTPYNAPKEYWDLYDRKDMKALCPVIKPDNCPELNWSGSAELRGYKDCPSKGIIPDEIAARFRHGYYAATSYVDANVGKLITALEESGVADNTIIIFWSDHGYHLGENSHWTKVTLRDLDAQVPLLVAVPGKKEAQTDALVEYIDMYPTLSDLCGLPKPKGLDGRSFISVLEDPTSDFREAALTQTLRPWGGKRVGSTMGYSIRTPKYRYVMWINRKDKYIIAEELYDMEKDPFQRNNIFNDSEFNNILSKHRELLEATILR